MNLAVLRTYALQLEEVAKLELADLSRALQHTVSRMAAMEAQAHADADRYVSLMQEGSTVAQAYSQLDAMDQAISARKGMEQAHAGQQVQWTAKRDELIEAMQYRKKLDLLCTRAVQEHRRRQERQDQQLLDERAWRRLPPSPGGRP